MLVGRMSDVPAYLQTLVDRWEPDAFDSPSGRARIRLAVTRTNDAWDVTTKGSSAWIKPANPDKRPDATLTADEQTWKTICEDLRGGMEAYGRSKLRIRDNLHIGVGFLAATSGLTDPGRLEYHRAKTRVCELSYLQAGTGPQTI